MKIFSLTILFMLPVTSIYAMDLPGLANLKNSIHSKYSLSEHQKGSDKTTQHNAKEKSDL